MTGSQGIAVEATSSRVASSARRPRRGTESSNWLAILVVGLVALGSPCTPWAAEPDDLAAEALGVGFAPVVSALPAGGFLVAWAVPETELDSAAVEARLLDDQGNPLTHPFRINESPIQGFGANPRPVTVAALGDGSIFVAWRYQAEVGDGEIYGRLFSAEGMPTSGEIRVSASDERQLNADGRGDQRSPSAVGLTGGGVAVVWESERDRVVRVYGRVFNSDLDPLTADFPIDDGEYSRQELPRVVRSEGGGFAVRWQVTEEAQRSRVRRFEATGIPVSASTPAPSSSSETRGCVTEVRGRPGSAIRTWIDGCSDLGVIYAQGVEVIFADGFESGDTSAWSAREPRATLSFVSPAPGACLASATPGISLVFTDPAGGGLDAATFALTANETPVFTSCNFGPGTIDCDVAEPLPEGLVLLVARVEDVEGHAAVPSQVSVTVDTMAPAPIDTGRVTVAPDGSGGVSVGGGPDAAEPGAEVTVLNQTTLEEDTVTAGADGSFLASLGGAEGDTLGLTQADCGGNTSTAALVTVPGGGQPLPPNPPDVAPPIDPTVPTDFGESTVFIYSGPDPIQTGVVPGVIEETRVSILRGRVLARGGAPIPGVRITCHGHPEVGETLTRADGMFDLAVNGGSEVVLVYEKTGYLPAQREILAPRRDFSWAPDTFLVPLDPVMTTIETDATEMQVAQGSEVTDDDGTRQATVLVPAGTEAELVFEDGSTQPLSSMDLRVSEFTVGDEGPAAMPGPLPPNVAYTWAAEISADEAIAAGASRVQFDQPLVVHLDNFIGMPVGEPVPLGYYDRGLASWVGSDNGLVIEILSVNGQGLAELDLDGSGQPADAAALAALGVSDDERRELAKLYSPGTSLWRLPIPHLTPWDANWPLGPAEDAVPPPDDDIEDDDDGDDPDPNEPADPTDPNTPPDPEREKADEQEPDCQDGSIIECQNQVLGESITIPGTGLALHYSSDRVPGSGGNRYVQLRLSEEMIPDTLEEIELEIRVGGNRFIETFAPAPDLVYDLTWDGLDAYGRALQAPQPVTVIKRYHYKFENYGRAAQFVRSWERFSGGEFDIRIPNVRKPARYVWARESRILPGAGARQAGTWDARGVGLGGWSLSAHHTYHPQGRTLYLGTGARRRVQRYDTVLSLVAGGQLDGYGGDGGPATEALLDSPAGLALGPAGSLYVAELDNHVVRRIDPNGIITTIAGSGVPCNDSQVDPSLECGDGGPATLARLNSPAGVDLEADGSLLIADYLNECVRRVTPNGTIETAAGRCIAIANPEVSSLGGGGLPLPCEDCPATDVDLSIVSDVLALAGGGFLIVTGDQILRITPEGLIQSFAGDPDATEGGDGGPATQAMLNNPLRIAQGPDGALYVAEGSGHRIRRIGPDGIISTVAGTGVRGLSGDGGPAIQAQLDVPKDVAVGPDGTLFIADGFNKRIRRVTPSGRIDTVVGGGTIPLHIAEHHSTAVFLPAVGGIVLSPGGEQLYVSDERSSIHRHGPPLPGFDGGELTIPSEDGNQLYVFDPDGRHLRTVDSLTGEGLLSFAYTPEGRLGSATTGDSLVTTVERDTEGVPTAIIGPYGHRTELEIDGAGWLAEVMTPEGRTHHLTHTSQGLLVNHVDPEGNASTYEYDPSGRLKRAINRAGLIKELTRYGFGEDYRVELRYPLQDGMLYHVDNRADGGQVRSRSLLSASQPSGLVTETAILSNGRRIITHPDGTVVTMRQGGDPRLGMAAPLTLSGSVELPSGLEWAFSRTREVALADPADPLSLESLTDSVVVNGRTYTRDYDAATRTFVQTTPEGRLSSVRVDLQRRPIEITTPGLAPFHVVYDADGRVDEIRQGTGVAERVIDYAYNPEGLLERVTDSLLRETVLLYDDDARPVTQQLPGERLISVAYDGNGNLESVTTPNGDVHQFGYTGDELPEFINPPDVAGLPNDLTGYQYDENRRLAVAFRPTGDEIGFWYDSFGRLDRIAYSGAGPRVVRYDYLPSTGRLEKVHGPGSFVRSYLFDGPLLTSSFQQGAVSGGVAWTYTDDFWPATETINGTDAISFEYDDDGLLERAGALDIQRDPVTGFPEITTLGLVTTSTVVDEEFAEYEVLAAAVNGSEAFRIDYVTRDKLGRVVEKQETLSGVTDSYSYEYDDAGRLETVTKNGSPFASYTYDANGNRLSYDGTFGSVSSTQYDEQDRLVVYGDAEFTYKASGEIASRTENGQAATYVHDSFGNLIRTVLPDGIQIDYILDAQGRRVGKRINGVLSQGLLYRDHLSPVAEINGSGVVVARFVYGTRPHSPDYMVKEGVTYRLLADQLGSIRLVVDVATGVVAQRLDYDEYGRVLVDTNPGFQPFGFAGGIYDRQTGLVLFGARNYDPSTGRWTSKDPSGLWADTNAYAYAYNDPVNFIDPDGEAAIAIVGFVALVVVTVVVVTIVTSPEYQENAQEAAEGLQKWWEDRVAPRPLPFPMAPGNDFPGFYDETCGDAPGVPFPGWDPAAPPREGTEWRGKPPVGGREGNWHDPATGESWHPDLDHAAPKGPHWDYWDPSGNKWWVDPTGKVNAG